MRAVVAAGVVGVLLLTGCGSDDDDPVAATTTSAAASSTPPDSGSSSSGSGSSSTSESGTASPSGGATPPTLEGKVADKGRAELAADGTIDVEADDFYFKPTFVKAKPGTKVTVTFMNEGEKPHTFTIDDPKVDKELQKGAPEAEVTFTMPASGTLNFYCRFHRKGGMQGAFFTG